MRKATYLQLLSVTVTTILLVVAVAILHPFGSIEDLWKAGVTAVGGLLLLVVAFTVFQVTLKNQESVWLQPVSRGVSKTIINIVVVIWLFVVGLFVFMVLYVKGGSPFVILTTAISLIGAAWGGRFLQKRLSSDSLLSYGVTFFAALVVILVVFAIPAL